MSILVDKFENAVLRTEKERNKKRDPARLSISSLGKCVRQLTYRALGHRERGMDGRSALTLAVGTAMHTYLRRAFKKRFRRSKTVRIEGFPKEIETSVVVGGHKIEGHIDGKVWIGGKAYLLELKTMSDWAYRDFVRYDVLDYSYVIQTLAYMEGTGLHTAIVIGVNKNTGEMKEFFIDFEASKKTWLDRKAFLDRHIQSPDLATAPKEYGPDDKSMKLPWQCGYCPFVLECWADRKPKEESRNKFILTS